MDSSRELIGFKLTRPFESVSYIGIEKGRRRVGLRGLVILLSQPVESRAGGTRGVTLFLRQLESRTITQQSQRFLEQDEGKHPHPFKLLPLLSCLYLPRLTCFTA